LPRGLAFTEAGDILRHHCQHAFRELNEGVATISGVQSRQSVRIAVARSYATRVLSHRTASFVERYPWLELVLDGHRHLVDLFRNEADAAIRVGDGRWPEISSEKIADDPIFPVASPALVASYGSSDLTDLIQVAPLLHYMERPYWETWTKGAGIEFPKTQRSVRFSESIMTLEAAEAGQGIAIARHSLVREALARGRLVRVSPHDVDDGIAYYFCATPDAARKQ
jgi:DNA-binding transcriptional LysR family regulator